MPKSLTSYARITIYAIILAQIFNLIVHSHAYAYLDPNAGGIFLQVIVPMVFAAAAAITVFWRRVIGHVKNVIKRILGRNNS